MLTRGTGLESAGATGEGAGGPDSRAGNSEGRGTAVSLSAEEIIARDLKLANGLDELVDYIQAAKREIAALGPDEIRREHIPAATDELDAIVAHTEEATGFILDAAERIEGLTAEIPGKTGQALSDAVTSIYEACNFQDITGQRVGKVVATLKHIEERIEALAMVVGDAPELAAPASGPRRPAGKPAEPSSDEALLNGPQLPGAGNSQDEIDALLEGDG